MFDASRARPFVDSSSNDGHNSSIRTTAGKGKSLLDLGFASRVGTCGSGLRVRNLFCLPLYRGDKNLKLKTYEQAGRGSTFNTFNVQRSAPTGDVASHGRSRKSQDWLKKVPTGFRGWPRRNPGCSMAGYAVPALS